MRRPFGSFSQLVALMLVLAGDAAASSACKRQSLQDHPVTVCRIDLNRQALRLYWKDAADRPYGSLSDIATRARPQPGRMVFAMNAGMYHDDLSPVGLYVENGQTLKKASLAGGAGNFHLLPNGVFYLKGNTGGVMETRRFARAGIAADHATQSGPMLVVDGRLHPKFTGRGQSAKIRNGVGMVDAKTFVFVISEEPVTFTAFARMFRDDLKARNALYLDGSISSLYAPSAGRADRFMPVGPIVAGFDR